MRHARMMWFHASSALCLLSLACASSGASTESGTPRVRPPEMLSRATPALQIPNVANRSPIRIELEVEVDEAGQADVETLKLTGAGAVENRLVIQQWLQQARFRPANQQGMAVRGVYKTSLEVRTGIRVVRRGG